MTPVLLLYWFKALSVVSHQAHVPRLALEQHNRYFEHSKLNTEKFVPVVI
jgi:cation transport ATPase